MAAWRNTNGAAAAIEAAIERKKEEQAKAEEQLKSGDAIDLPPPPEHPVQNKAKKKKKAYAGPRMEAPPVIDGEVLSPLPIEEVETKERYPQTNLPGPPLVFPLDTAAKVFDLARCGLKPRTLCKHIDNPLTGKHLTEDLLLQYFGEEVRRGSLQGARETLHSLQAQITGEGGVKRNIAAAIFRSKQDPFIEFSETTTVVHSTAQAEELKKRIEQLDEQDLLKLRSILAKRVNSRDDARRKAISPAPKSTRAPEKKE
jgi:hypothetical protein